ncbi:unnamed protein product [Eruca vesicaria subsp. sativa]|uniref:Uncharacterized protein n=1 Tax=Eruca vesicaria subsp. sativa TaxID=29727 RepID=A0ABC8K156_ERUVS|nr:unnamed protein product [Eruca vesicaria subsp. sativa]
MASSNFFFSDLQIGRCSYGVQARLLRFRQSGRIRRGGEIQFIDLLFVDGHIGRCSYGVQARLLRFRQSGRIRRGGEIQFIDLLFVDGHGGDGKATSNTADRSSAKMHMPQTTMKSLCNSLLFSDSLKSEYQQEEDLKNLSTQLYSAAIVVETPKDYMIKALVNTVVHLDAVIYKVNEFVDEKVDQVAGTELRKLEADKALRGDLQPEQAPSSATKTGILPTTPWTLMKQIHQAWLRKRRVASAPLVQQVQQTINPT